MGAGYRQLDADGYKKLNSDGETLLVDEGEACCCGGCPESVEATFTGVDATICPCFNYDGGGITNSQEPVVVEADGVYVLPKTSESDTVCVYGATFSISGEANFYSSADCAGTPDNRTDSTGRVNIQFDKVLNQITIAHLFWSLKGFNEYGFRNSDLANGIGGFDEDINQGFSCGAPPAPLSGFQIADGGSVRVVPL